ncbi:MAG: IclR family transcriptional regulator [Pseudomonadota bacterium]
MSVKTLEEGTDRDTGSVVFRSLNLITAIAQAGRPLAAPELAALLALPKPTVHRICQKLEGEGYLVREPGVSKYGVGPRLFALGLNIVQSGLSAERHAILSRLVEDIGETCNFTAPIRDEVYYLDRVEARWPLRLHLEPGSRVPMHCTSSGKIFLSAMPPSRRERILSLTGMPAMTSNTITTPDAMDAELAKISEQGYSVDREEFLMGLVAIAVPVRNTRGTVVAALACHGPTGRFNMEAALDVMPLLRKAADQFEATM